MLEPVTRETVPAADRCFVGLPNPMIPATIELAHQVPLARITDLVAARLLSIPRMSHRLVLPSSAASYCTACADLDISAHMREHRLADGTGYAELRRLIEERIQTPVDPSRPPWDITLIHRPGSGSILFIRVHHAITDGRGLTAILAACADEAHTTLLPQTSPSRPAAPGLLRRIVRTARNVADLRHLARSVEPHSSIKRTAHPEAVAVAWLQRPLVLADLKRVARAMGGGTVNDVILAAIAGALRTYMRAHGDDLRRSITGMVLVDVLPQITQKHEAEIVLGNHIGYVLESLPVDVGTPAERYARVSAAMQRAKAGYRSRLAAAALNVLGRSRHGMGHLAIAGDARRTSCYVSNMKGPSVQMHLAGIPVVDVRCHPLSILNIGVSFAAYSYNGGVNIAICTDRELVAEPDVLCRYLADEVQLLAIASKDTL
ncbi:hypothetical protein FB451DRAFT_1369327 [Mycena latifolia]|nr:hypothetical protein FB451DRAFT_1369327 [Mycena latifolia]